jgi:hypothetical protein
MPDNAFLLRPVHPVVFGLLAKTKKYLVNQGNKAL